MWPSAVGTVCLIGSCSIGAGSSLEILRAVIEMGGGRRSQEYLRFECPVYEGPSAEGVLPVMIAGILGMPRPHNRSLPILLRHSSMGLYGTGMQGSLDAGTYLLCPQIPCILLATKLPRAQCDSALRLLWVQVQGEESQAAVDIYSFGVVMWEICTGETPSNRYYRKIENHEAPAEIIDLISRCLHFTPSVRPTAADLVSELMNLQPAQRRRAQPRPVVSPPVIPRDAGTPSPPQQAPTPPPQPQWDVGIISPVLGTSPVGSDAVGDPGLVSVR
jgi:hypothetical protein